MVTLAVVSAILRACKKLHSLLSMGFQTSRPRYRRQQMSYQATDNGFMRSRVWSKLQVILRVKCQRLFKSK